MIFPDSSLITGAMILTGAILLAPAICYAVPTVTSVSGAGVHDGVMTISGSGFGTKSPAAPIRWETFEDGTVGENVTTTGYWSAETPARTLFDDDTHIPTRHAHSGKHIHWGGLSEPTGTRSFYKDNVGFASTKKAYVNLWLYMDFVSGVPELSQGWQLKLFRIQGGPSHAEPPYFINNVMTLDEVTVSYWVVPIYHNPSIWPGSGWMREGYWVNMAMEYKDSSTVGSADGAAHFYSSYAPPSGGTYYKGSRTGIVTRHDDVTACVDCLMMGYLLVNGGDAANTYWDDVYIDKSWARVEIGDAATYATCTHREVQIPSVWSSSSVTVTVNQGSFPDEQQGYLYVVDETGSVNSSGYPVTLGQVAYTLTVTNGAGSGDYDEGEVVGISANPPASGKAFAMWIGDTLYVDDTNAPSTTVTMPASDISVTATYRFVYQLTVNSGTGGGEYPASTIVPIAADAVPTGMVFREWTGDTSYVSDVDCASTTVTMPSSAVEITASYRLRGDLSADGFVGQTDLDIVLDQWGHSGGEISDPRADANDDDFVGQTDLDIVLDQWGQAQ